MEADRITTDLRNHFKKGDIVIRLLYINIGVFLVIKLVGIGFTLFKSSLGPWTRFLELPASIPQFLRQPWTLLTYMFMHLDVWHVLFNMLCLYWFGRLALNVFSAKHVRGLYVLGGICGGLLYILSYNIFPYFEDMQETPLVGASASVLAIIIATAGCRPNLSMRFLLVGEVKLKYLAGFLVFLDFMMITSGNGGGHIAHLGGALAGWWFSVGFSRGRDATKWINGVLDFCAGNWKPSPRRPKMKVHFNDKQKDYDFNARKKARAEEVDRILDKLRKSGYGSLTEEEKKALFDASKK